MGVGALSRSGEACAHRHFVIPIPRLLLLAKLEYPLAGCSLFPITDSKDGTVTCLSSALF